MCCVYSLFLGMEKVATQVHTPTLVKTSLGKGAVHFKPNTNTNRLLVTPSTRRSVLGGSSKRASFDMMGGQLHCFNPRNAGCLPAYLFSIAFSFNKPSTMTFKIAFPLCNSWWKVTPIWSTNCGTTRLWSAERVPIRLLFAERFCRKLGEQ